MSKVEFVAEFHCIVIDFFSLTLVNLTLESSLAAWMSGSAEL